MGIEQNDIDIDNFIKERINNRRSQGPTMEPSPDFSRRTIDKIYRLEKRKRFLALYHLTAFWAAGPLVLRQLWLLVRNDYFSASHLPLGGMIVGAYNLFLSLAGTFLLLVAGIFASLLFVFKLRRGNYSEHNVLAMRD